MIPTWQVTNTNSINNAQSILDKRQPNKSRLVMPITAPCPNPFPFSARHSSSSEPSPYRNHSSQRRRSHHAEFQAQNPIQGWNAGWREADARRCTIRSVFMQAGPTLQCLLTACIVSAWACSCSERGASHPFLSSGRGLSSLVFLFFYPPFLASWPLGFRKTRIRIPRIFACGRSAA